MRAIVTGMIATYPVGGVLWDYGQYALGLEQLGVETYYLEDTGWESYDPRRGCYGNDYSYGIDFLAGSLKALSPTLADRWHVCDVEGKAHGMSHEAVEELAATADVFLNVSGGTLLRDRYMRCPNKVLLDTDPGWNHFVNYPKWDASPGWQGSNGYRAHDRFFTYAERIGRGGCRLPDLGIRWQATRPPVVLDRWAPEPPGASWTTVMTWDNFRQNIEHEGVVYGTKEKEFAHVEDMPRRTMCNLEVAVGGSDPPVRRWEALGWEVRSSEAISRSAGDYRSYIQGSRGEFSVAKNLYAATRSGWFSCRSVCYLAAGRPVVIQDTGFSETVETGEGLHAFTTPDEAEKALLTVEQDYEHHSRAAREVAQREFDARIVLRELLERAT